MYTMYMPHGACTGEQICSTFFPCSMSSLPLNCKQNCCLQCKPVLCNSIRQNTAKKGRAKLNKDPTAAVKAKVTMTGVWSTGGAPDRKAHLGSVLSGNVERNDVLLG